MSTYDSETVLAPYQYLFQLYGYVRRFESEYFGYTLEASTPFLVTQNGYPVHYPPRKAWCILKENATPHCTLRKELELIAFLIHGGKLPPEDIQELESMGADTVPFVEAVWGTVDMQQARLLRNSNSLN